MNNYIIINVEKNTKDMKALRESLQSSLNESIEEKIK